MSLSNQTEDLMIFIINIIYPKSSIFIEIDHFLHQNICVLNANNIVVQKGIYFHYVKNIA